MLYFMLYFILRDPVRKKKRDLVGGGGVLGRPLFIPSPHRSASGVSGDENRRIRRPKKKSDSVPDTRFNTTQKELYNSGVQNFA